MKSNGTRVDTQFSVFLANKPRVLARVCQQLAEDKVNILALSMMDASEHGVLRIVAEDPARARAALDHLQVAHTETPVLLTTLANRPGAMADVVERLASSGVQVTYAYCTTGGLGGHTLGVFRVSDIKKAEHILGERRPKRKFAATARTAPAPRRR